MPAHGARPQQRSGRHARSAPPPRPRRRARRPARLPLLALVATVTAVVTMLGLGYTGDPAVATMDVASSIGSWYPGDGSSWPRSLLHGDATGARPATPKDAPSTAQQPRSTTPRQATPGQEKHALSTQSASVAKQRVSRSSTRTDGPAAPTGAASTDTVTDALVTLTSPAPTATDDAPGPAGTSGGDGAPVALAPPTATAPVIGPITDPVVQSNAPTPPPGLDPTGPVTDPVPTPSSTPSAGDALAPAPTLPPWQDPTIVTDPAAGPATPSPSAAPGTDPVAPVTVPDPALPEPWPLPTSPFDEVAAPPVAPADSSLVMGVNDHPIWMASSQDTEFGYVASSHAGAVRIDVPWDIMSGSTKGTYDMGRVANIDAYVDRAYAAGIDVDMVVTNAPQWANGSTDPRMPPINNNDYADYLQWLMQRYAGKVSAYEIWNEPNGGWAWTHPDAVKYAALLKVAYTRAKSIDPSVTILAPSLSGPDQAAWLTTFYAQGTKNYFDAFSMHGYWWNLSGSTVLPYWDAAHKDASIFGAFDTRIRPVMARYGDQDKPVWWTETGISTQGQGTTSATQAQKISEAYTAFRARVVPTMTRLYWYDIVDSVGTGSEQNFGLVDNTGSSATTPTPSQLVPKPAFTAFQEQARLTP